MCSRNRQSAFTLLELILVMLIITIIAGILAPSLGRFTAGQAVNNFGRQIVGLSQYARAQSISEARVCYLNFDAAKVYLTLDSPGAKGNQLVNVGAPLSVPVPTGIRMQVVQNAQAAQPVMLLPWPANFQAQAHPQPNQLLDGTAVGAGSIWVFPQNNAFVQFQPTGRTDPATIELTDNSGHKVQVVCDLPTDRFHIQEAGR
ncbi:MAG: prepilin-type N-terminal cleavage/methylation domain-containing protein [Tepidisphaeraceae bacterium]|jgi:prepilin-type N-terminal cleavage/methylation domain-containing protein